MCVISRHQTLFVVKIFKLLIEDQMKKSKSPKIGIRWSEVLLR